MISFVNVSKSLGNLQLLNNFNISFDENKVTCIFGPSGVGKSTIANMAAELISIDKGEIKKKDATVYSYVFQDPRLLPWYSVYDNIDYVLKDVYDDEKRVNIINNYIKMVGLKGYENYKPNALSGGMCQRVSLARAFAYPSNFLILDEPFKGLDIKLKNEMIILLKKLLLQSERTVLFITHDIDEAVSLSDTIYIINKRPIEIIKKINMEDESNELVKKMLSTF